MFHHPNHLEILYMDPLMYLFLISIELLQGHALFKSGQIMSHHMTPEYWLSALQLL